MDPRLRAAITVLALGALLLAGGFLWGAGWATGLWPVGAGYGGSALSQAFAASILASVGVSGLWVAAAGETRAVAGGGLDLAVILGGSGLVGVLAGARTGWAWPALALGAAFLLLAIRCHRVPFRDDRPVPGAVRAAFGLFVLVLVAEASLLLSGLPEAFPWTLSRGNQVIYAFVFLGAAAFFLYAIRWPAWGVAGPLLAGFLAYDLVLLGPLVGRLGAVEPARLPSLIVYLAAVGGSALLAAWSLLLDPRTRGLAAPRPA